MPNVALVLSGAVSLGSWEAGVLDELVYQLVRLNNGLPEKDHYKIDVVTGASAGAMTAALVGRAVMIDIDDRRFFRNAWVDEIDITRLLQGIPANALLSKDPIREIAETYLATPAQAHPSSIAPARLLMRFTVTNMTGVDYELNSSAPPNAPYRRFTSTFHAETREFEIKQSDPLDSQNWENIRAAAIASGNFPFAFQPQMLKADRAPWKGSPVPWSEKEFAYIDGGLFNNEPLGEAVELARTLDSTPERPGIDPTRIFLLVDANLNGSKRDPSFSDRSGIPSTVRRTLAVLLGESQALDWYKAQRFNNEVQWRDEVLDLLAGLILDTRVRDPEAFLQSLEGAAEAIVQRKRSVLPGRYGPNYRDEAIDRNVAASRKRVSSMDPTQTRIFGALAFLLNSVAGLDKKDRLENLHVIYTTPDETAGDRMQSFAGFFSHAWRLHDYQVGRRTANEQLSWVLEGQQDPYPREPNVDYDPMPLGDVDMSRADRRAREETRDAAMHKVSQLAKDLSVGPKILSWALSPLAKSALRKAVRKQLDKLLHL